MALDGPFIEIPNDMYMHAGEPSVPSAGNADFDHGRCERASAVEHGRRSMTGRGTFASRQQRGEYTLFECHRRDSHPVDGSVHSDPLASGQQSVDGAIREPSRHSLSAGYKGELARDEVSER
jgi:hypothetical protein